MQLRLCVWGRRWLHYKRCIPRSEPLYAWCCPELGSRQCWRLRASRSGQGRSEAVPGLLWPGEVSQVLCPLPVGVCHGPSPPTASLGAFLSPGLSSQLFSHHHVQCLRGCHSADTGVKCVACAQSHHLEFGASLAAVTCHEPWGTLSEKGRGWRNTNLGHTVGWSCHSGSAAVVW